MKKIVIIDDDEKFVENFIRDFNNSFEIIVIDNFEDVLNQLNVNFDLAIVDAGLPDIDSKVLCSVIINELNKPAIMLTSNDSEDNLLNHLQIGVIDYMLKPYNQIILTHKINNILNLSKNNNLKYKNLVLDTSKQTINDVKLTQKEYILIKFFIQNNNKIIEFDDILEFLWQSNEFMEKTAFYTLLSRSRIKIKKVSDVVELLTVKGQGVILQ